MADDQVAFENSIIARDKMLENGAEMVVATDLNSDFNHTECVTPAATSFVFYLLVFAELTSTDDLFTTEFTAYPNPTGDHFYLKSDALPAQFNLEIYDYKGSMMYQNKNVSVGNMINPQLACGSYILLLKDDQGEILGYKKLVFRN